MLKVGITGGIGSGKTTVSGVFARLGIPVYYADQAAAEIYSGEAVQQQLIQTFGILTRKELADLVFSNKRLLEKLNAIIHPAVELDFIKWCEQHREVDYVLKEAAILFESGANKGLDFVITINSTVEMRMERVMKREGYSRQEVERRMSNQWTEEEKIKRSDFVIYNDEQQLIIPQILEVHNYLLAKSRIL